MEEEDSDPDKKHFSVEQRKAQFEKKLFWIMMLVLLLTWIFVLQDMLLEHGQQEWGWAYSDASKGPILGSKVK